jgi:uncharacterized protein (TIGR00730 family)
VNESIEALNSRNQGLLKRVLDHLASLDSDRVDQEDIALGLEAVSELLDASQMFSRYEGISKVAVFGSARTSPASPLYELAREVGEEIGRHGWMTVTGAGGGIMEAAAIGSGIDHSLGVNIKLPFEQFTTPHIDWTTKLVTLQHFFTRKTALTRPCEAFIVLPGGFGTLDELFEILTLAHTGKMKPSPIVLLDTHDGTYWKNLLAWIENEVSSAGYIGSIDLRIVDLVTSPQTATEVIERFYSNYQAFSDEGGRATMTLLASPTPEQIELVRSRFESFNNLSVTSNVLHFDFDGKNFVEVRLLIDLVNSWV